MARTQTSMQRSARPRSDLLGRRVAPTHANPTSTKHSALWWTGAAVAVAAGGVAVYYGYRYLTTPRTTPAGQAVVPYAGFDRPDTAGLSNRVGANPGYATMIDPMGLNIGLWQTLYGASHAPLGTGNVAADVDQNQVAGQPGGYWAGHPGA